MLLRLALTLLFTSLSHAQSGKGKVEVRFLAERVPADIGQVNMIAEGKLSDPFDLPTNNLSSPQEAPARVFSLRPVGKDTALVNIALPAEGKAFIVILIPAAKAGYSPVIIAAENASFKPGDIYFYNHSNKTVLGYVGTAKFTLAPTKGHTLRPKGARAEGFYDVGFGVREKEGNRALSSTRWPVDNQIRSYVFFFINPKTKRLDFRAIDEFVPLKKAKP